MLGIVPEVNDRLGSMVLIAEDRKACGLQEEVPTRAGLEPEPAGRQHAQEMPAGKDQDIAHDGPHLVQDTVGPRPNLLRGLSSRTAVAEELPVRALGVDLGAGAPLVLAVVPFGEIVVDLGRRSKSGQLACADCAPKRARNNPCELAPAQPLAEPAGVLLPALGQREIRHSRVLTREAPSGLAVPGQIDARELIQDGYDYNPEGRLGQAHRQRDRRAAEGGGAEAGLDLILGAAKSARGAAV